MVLFIHFSSKQKYAPKILTRAIYENNMCEWLYEKDL